MKRASTDTGEETPKKTKEEMICPLCESPLIGEAIEAGKCQCCGHRFEPKELKKTRSSQA